MSIRRSGLALLNFGAGVAMIGLALNVQFGYVAAESADCNTEIEACEADQACCDGVCFDPETHTCDCEGNIVPLE